MIKEIVKLMERTKENWTYGIINIPLLFGHNNRLGVNPRSILRKWAHNAKCYRKPFPCVDKSFRYLWFELDSLENHEQVLEYFKECGVDVFWHRTMKGYHYITLHLMPVAEYDATMMQLKQVFNNATFFYSLRIVPNKWVNEVGVWYNGGIEDNGSGHVKQLSYIQKSLNQKYVFNYNKTTPKTVEMLDNMFCISRYEFKKNLQVGIR
jgi:hypothetical protein